MHGRVLVAVKPKGLEFLDAQWGLLLAIRACQVRNLRPLTLPAPGHEAVALRLSPRPPGWRMEPAGASDFQEPHILYLVNIPFVGLGWIGARLICMASDPEHTKPPSPPLFLPVLTLSLSHLMNNSSAFHYWSIDVSLILPYSEA